MKAIALVFTLQGQVGMGFGLLVADMVLLSLAKALPHTDMRSQFSLTEDKIRYLFPDQDLNMRLGMWKHRIPTWYFPPTLNNRINDFDRQIIEDNFFKVYEEWYKISNAKLYKFNSESQGGEDIFYTVYFNYEPIIKSHYEELVESFIENNLQ